MGTVGKEIIEIDANELIKELNRALADEWFAYYQYWMGAKVICTSSAQIIGELQQHAEEELKHANLLVARILQLGGVPLLHPKDWFEEKHCEYAAPKDFDPKVILKQNILGEQCAIKTYKDLIEMTRGKDDITYQLVVGILKEEVEHEDELEKMLETY